MKKIVLSLILFFILSGAAFASSLYGPGYGFNTDPDLGPVFTLQAVKSKVTYSWCIKRANQLVKQGKLSGKLDVNEIAIKLHGNFNGGMIMDSRLPQGAQIIAVSSGSGNWSFDREWIGPDQDYWANTIKLDCGMIIHFGLTKLCGNLDLLRVEYQPPIPPQKVPPPVEQPPEKWQPSYSWETQKVEQGSNNTFTTYSSIGFVPSPKQETNINLKMDNSNTNNIANNIANTLQQWQNMVNNIANTNINNNTNNNNNLNNNSNTNNNGNTINVQP